VRAVEGMPQLGDPLFDHARHRRTLPQAWQGQPLHADAQAANSHHCTSHIMGKR
jgi:hypothetical protein